MEINFKKYHSDNPHIYAQFVKYARKTKERGFKNYSANGIFELIRWHTGIKGNDCFKLNNIYRPDYARKIMEELPDEFAGFFRVRVTTSKRV